MTTQSMPNVNVTEQEKRTVEVAGAGATTEAIGAAGAIVLAIIGLAGILPAGMMATGAIVLGAALLLDAGAVGARYREVVRSAWSGDQQRLVRAELGGGISAGAFAGVAGVVLGILALVGLSPETLCSIALIAFGGALLFGSAEKSRLASLHASRYGLSERAGRVIDEALGASASGEVLAGLGGVVLGILALLGLVPTTLVLVGFLGVGAAVLLSGTAFGARMFGIMRHEH